MLVEIKPKSLPSIPMFNDSQDFREFMEVIWMKFKEWNGAKPFDVHRLNSFAHHYLEDEQRHKTIHKYVITYHFNEPKDAVEVEYWIVIDPLFQQQGRGKFELPL